MTPWAAACQAPLSMGFSRREYWNGFPFPFPRDLPDPGIKCLSALQADSLPLSRQGSPSIYVYNCVMDEEFIGCMLDCLIGGENLNLEGESSLQAKDKEKKAYLCK